jgi:hypothetical protein
VLGAGLGHGGAPVAVSGPGRTGARPVSGKWITLTSPPPAPQSQRWGRVTGGWAGPVSCSP